MLPTKHLVHREETEKVVQQHRAYQTQFFLLQLVLHTLRVFHGEAAHLLLQVSDRQDECNPNLNRWTHSNLAVCLIHRAS